MSSKNDSTNLIWDDERTELAERIVLRQCQYWWRPGGLLSNDYENPLDLAQDIWVRRFKAFDRWKDTGDAKFSTWVRKNTDWELLVRLKRRLKTEEKEMRPAHRNVLLQQSYDPFGYGAPFWYRDVVDLADIYGWRYIPDAVRFICQGNTIDDAARMVGIHRDNLRIALTKFEKWAAEKAA